MKRSFLPGLAWCLACGAAVAGFGHPADPRGSARNTMQGGGSVGPALRTPSRAPLSPSISRTRLSPSISRAPAPKVVARPAPVRQPSISPPSSLNRRSVLSGRTTLGQRQTLVRPVPAQPPAISPATPKPVLPRTVTRSVIRPSKLPSAGLSGKSLVTPGNIGQTNPAAPKPPLATTIPQRPSLRLQKPSVLSRTVPQPASGNPSAATIPGSLDKRKLGTNRSPAFPGSLGKPALVDQPSLGTRKPSLLPDAVQSANAKLPSPGTKRPSALTGTLATPAPENDRPSALSGKFPRPGNQRPARPFDRPQWQQAKPAAAAAAPADPPHLTPVSGNRPGWGGDQRPWWADRPPTAAGHGDTARRWLDSVDHNFKDSWNWSRDQDHWGCRPWWNRPACHPWYGRHWDYCWNRRWYACHSWYCPPRPWPGYVIVDDGLCWGIAAWGLGSLIYQTGYLDYYNPYPAVPVTLAGGAVIDYSEPLSVLASRTAPADEQTSRAAEQDAVDLLDRSRDAFKRGDYLAALPLAEQAIAATPGDSVLHEYRALVLFALGRYTDAAAVLNSVLAAGPGWDWETMVRLYDSPQTYAAQLRKLEQFSAANPNAADAHFLLGYHLLVAGQLDRAAAEFEAVAGLQPADAVARQLLNLCRNSAKPGEETPLATPEATPPAAPPAAQLVGSWQADKGKDGTVVLELSKEGLFAWTFTKDGKASKLEGNWSLNDKGLLVLDAGDSQMTGVVTLPVAGQLRFVLAGGPEGDPGLLFRSTR